MGVVLGFLQAAFVAEIAILYLLGRLGRQLAPHGLEPTLSAIRALILAHLGCLLLLWMTPTESALWIGIATLEGLTLTLAPTLACVVMCRLCEQCGLATVRESWRKCMMAFIACCLVPGITCSALGFKELLAPTPSSVVWRNLGPWVLLVLALVAASLVPWIWGISLSGSTSRQIRRLSRRLRGWPPPLARRDDLFSSAVVAVLVGVVLSGLMLSRCFN